jgi:hypothetical protein
VVGIDEIDWKLSRGDDKVLGATLLRWGWSQLQVQERQARALTSAEWSGLYHDNLVDSERKDH